MQIAIIGTGAVAVHHGLAIEQVPRAQLQGVASRTPEKARAFAERFKTRVYGSADEVFKDPAVQLVILCTYPDSHYQLASAAARRGKHLLVEKPLATTAETGMAIVEECRKAGVTLAVVSQKRFADGPVFLKKAVTEGRLGKLLQADAYMKWYREPAYYARPGKGGWDVEGGGAIINQAIHQVDLLRYIAGPVRSVRCMWQLGGLHAIPSEDSACVLMRYANGATGVIQASTALYPGFPDRLELHGTKGSVVTEGDFLKFWEVRQSEQPPAELFKQAGVGASKPMDIPVEPFRRQLENVIDAVEKGTRPLVSGEEGLETLRLVMSMYQSAREDRDVEVG